MIDYDINYTLASLLEFDPRSQMALIFVEGFYRYLKRFSKDKSRLIKAFAHAFDLNLFYVAYKNQEVIAITSCCNHNLQSIVLNKKELIKHLGFIKGLLAYYYLKKDLEVCSYPMPLDDQTGCIEFVATSPAFLHLNIGSNLLTSIIEKTSFQYYVLKVADNNLIAISMFEKLGFKEIKKVVPNNPKKAGFDNFIYMLYNKNH